MPEELKKCPFCGSPAQRHRTRTNQVCCSNLECGQWLRWVHEETWQKRPTEDALRARIEELEALLDPHAMTEAYMCGYQHGKNECKCGGRLESHMEISGDEIKTYSQCDKCREEGSE